MLKRGTCHERTADVVANNGLTDVQCSLLGSSGRDHYLAFTAKPGATVGA